MRFLFVLGRYIEDIVIPGQTWMQVVRSPHAHAMIETNWEFHHAIGLACGNRYLERMYSGLLTEGLRIARLAMAYECYGSVAAYEAHLGKILSEHRDIVRAIADRDSVRAAALSDSHSNLARKRVSDYLARNATREIVVAPSARTRKPVPA